MDDIFRLIVAFMTVAVFVAVLYGPLLYYDIKEWKESSNNEVDE